VVQVAAPNYRVIMRVQCTFQQEYRVKLPIKIISTVVFGFFFILCTSYTASHNIREHLKKKSRYRLVDRKMEVATHDSSMVEGGP